MKQLAILTFIIISCFSTFGQDIGEITIKKDSAIYQRNLGWSYETGENGHLKDSVKAFSYYQQAFKNDKVFAAYDLGRCYEYGIGIEKDHKKAFELYNLCAADTSSLYKLISDYGKVALGHCYYEGIGVEKDHNKAIEYWLMVTDAETPSHYGPLNMAKDYLKDAENHR